MITRDNGTGDKFSAGINNTSEQLSPVTMTMPINLSLVTGEQKATQALTPANNLSLVSLIPVISYSSVSLTLVIS
jgi:hypothetical protein